MAHRTVPGLATHEIPPEALQTGRTGTAAVVAPYASGAFYAREFGLRGWDSVAVTADQDAVPRVDQWRPVSEADFKAVVAHRGDVRATAARLRSLGVTAVVAGVDFVVSLTDALAAELGLPGNDPGTSAARYDKGVMAQALAAAGVPAIRSLATSSLQEALEWAGDIGYRTYVLKPVGSAGGDGVVFCRNRNELTANWLQLHGQANVLGGRNDVLLIQEKVAGTQILANSISWAGRHAITDIWIDHRIHTDDGHIAYDRLVLVSPQDAPDLYRQVTSYTCRALTALGIEYGPAHNELMLTPSGPVLVETGARPEGCLSPSAMALATGSHHVRDAVAAVINPDEVIERPPQVLQPAYRVMLHAPYDAIISEAGWRAMSNLPGVVGTVGHAGGGVRVQRTINLLTSPGSLYLAGPASLIEDSYQAIQRMQADGTFYIPVVP